jgi:putative endonuclease
MSKRSHLYGKKAEKSAIRYLKSHGLKFITQNFYSRFGEIDIIMESTTHIVFIEVKMRTKNNFGEPEEYVHLEKQHKLSQTALVFLQKHPKLRLKQPRFDVICLTPKKIHWIPHAFSTQSRYKSLL